MSVTYPNATKVARMTAVVTTIGTSGKLKLYASDGTTLLATFTLAATAGTVAGAGVLTLADQNGATAGILNTTASAAGTAALASITTSADVVVVNPTMTVGTSGTDIVLDNCVLASGQAITINSGTLTHV
ncbi:MAG: hypothetical protein WCN21_05475 [Comamonadaceae bacterium]